MGYTALGLEGFGVESEKSDEVPWVLFLFLGSADCFCAPSSGYSSRPFCRHFPSACCLCGTRRIQ